MTSCKGCRWADWDVPELTNYTNYGDCRYVVPLPVVARLPVFRIVAEEIHKCPCWEAMK